METKLIFIDLVILNKFLTCYVYPRINEDDIVIAKAAVTQKIVNIKTMNTSSHCEVKSSMLCMPIVRNNKTLGMV